MSREYLRDFLYEVVVGFHPIDDEPYNDIHWVSRFCSELSVRLRQLLETGYARVWNSEQDPFQSAGSCDDSRRPTSAATLVAILTPRYLSEGGLYAQHAARFAQVIGENSTATRLFNVYKLSCKTCPAGDLLGYKFWAETGPDEELELLYHDPKLHYQAINSLAHHIRDALRQLKNLRDVRPQVYLAPPPVALKSQYETVRDFLRPLCRIVPDTGFPPAANVGEFAGSVEALMAGSKLSIHILGIEDDPSPAGFFGATPARVQLDLACQKARRRELDCIVWCGEDPLEPSVRPDSLVRSILLERDLPSSVDKMMPDTLTALKQRIRQRLGVRNAANRTLYLIRHQADERICSPIERELRDDGFMVETANGDYRVSRFWRRARTTSGAIDRRRDLAGNSPLEWLRFIDYSVRVHLGQKPGTDLDRFAVYIGPQKTQEKEEFRTPLRAIRNFEAFAKRDLEPFLHAL